MEIRLLYAIDTETQRLVYAKNATRKQSWRCPKCQSPVMIKNRGKIRRAHFAHFALMRRRYRNSLSSPM
jgi:competence CoiA-like predicted nuclease